MLSQFVLNRRSGVPLNHQLRSQITRAILRGALAPGSNLPSATVLATDLGINQNTVRLAYRDLAHEGLLTTVRGHWQVVADVTERRERARRATLDDFHECVLDLVALGMPAESISAEYETALASDGSREPLLLLETFLARDVV